MRTHADLKADVEGALENCAELNDDTNVLKYDVTARREALAALAAAHKALADYELERAERAERLNHPEYFGCVEANCERGK